MFSDQTDEELMIAYKMGNSSAFDVLYQRHSQKIFAYLKSKTKEESLSYDIFQSTFLKLHKNKHLYNPSLPFLPWIFTICRNELIDFKRKQKIIAEELKEESYEISPSTTQTEIHLMNLNATQKTALNMRYTENATFDEIASALNTNPANVRKIISRSLQYLRGFYGQK